MLSAAAAALAPDAVLLRELLAVSLTGVILYSPQYDPSGSGGIVDFTFEYLNPAAQRMMAMPEVPTLTHNQQWPHSIIHGTFAFHVDAFVTGEPREYNVNYQADGYDNYYRLAARRVGTGLLVSFTDTADQPRSPVEVALRESQALEQAARAEVERQRQQLYQLFEQVPAMICVFDGPEHVFQFVNPPYQALVGPRPLLGLPIAQAMPELAGQPIFGLLDAVYQTGEPFHAHEMLVQLDHRNEAPGELEKHYYNFIYQARRTYTGAIDGILVFAYDVTSQVLARQQLQQLKDELEARVEQRTAQLRTEQTRLQQILGKLPASIALLTGPEHRHTFFNAAYQALAGGRVRPTLSVAAVYPEAVEQGFIGLLDGVYATGKPVRNTEWPTRMLNTATGQPQLHYLDFIYQALPDAQGQTQGILVFALDVTDKVLARQQRAAREQQLQDLFEQAPVAISILRGADYVVEVANPLVAQLWGRTPAELLGLPVFDALPEARDQGFKELLDGVRQSGEAFVAEGVPAQLLRDGTIQTVYLNYVYQPLRDAEGAVTSVAAVGTDVTAQVQDRQRVQELNNQLAAINGQLEASNVELAHSNQQLTRTNVDLDNFIYTASHDLKAPISNIEGLLYLLQEELPAAVVQDVVIGPTLTRMLDAVERFKRTIDHLTEVSKLQKEHTPAADSVNLAAVVEDVRQDLLTLLEATGTRLVVEVAATPPVHFAEKNLRSVVYNLLSNAVKYHSPDRTSHVDVRTHVRAGHTVLEVHDNGLGLAPAQLPKLFGMFQRFHDHVEGTGIGLYMVKRMVENAGGRIDVYSQLGAGTTFFVHLPHAAGPAA